MLVLCCLCIAASRIPLKKRNKDTALCIPSKLPASQPESYQSNTSSSIKLPEAVIDIDIQPMAAEEYKVKLPEMALFLLNTTSSNAAPSQI